MGKIYSIVLVICVILSSCSVSTEQIRREVLSSINEEFQNQELDISIQNFILVHEGGNHYKGILTTNEDGEIFKYEVAVVCDGTNYQWKIEDDGVNTSGTVESTEQKTSNSSTPRQVIINNEYDFRAYINNRTFQSLEDNLKWKFVNSENTWYSVGDGQYVPFGTLEVIKHITEIEGTIITFLVHSPYQNSTIRFSFLTPNTLFDQEGREYVMK
ncbi:MAG: hypothetical protein LBN37_00910 [Bacteroidales bacterium]|jgi:hypothetical protein|nr:hypothetical protein [Bacteroidales bacterium]